MKREVLWMSKASLALVAVMALVSLSGCLRQDFPDVPVFDAEAQLQEDIALIENYLRENGETATQTATGLFYQIDDEGTGAQVEDGDIVRVDYVGYTLDDRVFDTSKSLVAQGNNIYEPARDYEPIEFTVGAGQVIAGWEEGMLLLREGSSATLYIPSGLAYGPFGTSSGQFRNTVLIFEVDLVEVK